VLDQAGKNNAKLTVEQAEQLLEANEIEIDLGCLDAGSPVPQAERDLLELGATIDALGLDKPVADDLGNHVREASKQLAQRKLADSCRQLSDLTARIDEQQRKHKLTSGQAAQLRTEVTSIATEVGCGT
jgi:hypothetical protein